ncbi:MAG: hypothetical protein SGI77_15590 [Pirellulaceae bacterium]|nr:hypothetical protein [Pirellulaceae bacterium]
MTHAPRSIPGRTFTIVFGIILVLGVVLGFSVVIRFQEMMTALENVRHLWPKAAAVLEVRYRTLDPRFEADQNAIADDRAVALEQWRQLRIQFHESTQYDVQSRAVQPLESVIKRLLPETSDKLGKNSPDAAVAAFAQAEKSLESLQKDGIGWLSQLLLRLTIPEPIYSFLD